MNCNVSNSQHGNGTNTTTSGLPQDVIHDISQIIYELEQKYKSETTNTSQTNNTENDHHCQHDSNQNTTPPQDDTDTDSDMVSFADLADRGRISKDDFMNYAKEQGISEETASDFFDQVASRTGNEDSINMKDWKAAFGGLKDLSAQDFTDTVNNFDAGIAFGNYAAPEGSNVYHDMRRMTKDEFKQAAQDAGITDQATVDAAFTSIAGHDSEADSISVQDWHDAFGTLGLSKADFASATNKIANPYGFASIDANGDGNIDYDEFSAAAKQAGATDDKAIRSAFIGASSNGDGLLTQDEFNTAFGTAHLDDAGFKDKVTQLAGDANTIAFRMIAGETGNQSLNTVNVAELSAAIVQFGPRGSMNQTQFKNLASELGMTDAQATKAYDGLKNSSGNVTNASFIAKAKQSGTTANNDTTWTETQFKAFLKSIGS